VKRPIIRAAVVFFLPPPRGYTTQTMRAGALCALVIGLWALGALPEPLVGLLFVLLLCSLKPRFTRDLYNRKPGRLPVQEQQ
jgi:hypothetical protein